MNNISDTLGYYYNYLPAVPAINIPLNLFKRGNNEVNKGIEESSNTIASASEASLDNSSSIDNAISTNISPKLSNYIILILIVLTYYIVLYLSSIIISILSLVLPLVSTYNTIVLKNKSRVRELYMLLKYFFII